MYRLGNLNPCVDHRCNFGGSCKLVNNVPICYCHECPQVYKPVCGSNQVTYKYFFSFLEIDFVLQKCLSYKPKLDQSNICKLRRDSCQTQKLIELAYEGPCDRCKAISCLFYANCVDDGVNARCECLKSCSDVMTDFFLKQI